MAYCDRCLFASTYRDMGASAPICILQKDLLDACNFRASNDGKYSCPYAIFLCDLVDALSSSVGLPDREIIYSYGYLWSKETKSNGCNCDIHVVLKGVGNT